MVLKKLCLAVSLPFIAFISLYWIRQRKKDDKNAIDAQKVDSSDQVDHESTVVKRSIDQLAVQSSCVSNELANGSNNKSILEISTSDKSNHIETNDEKLIDEQSIHENLTFDRSTLEKSNYKNGSVGDKSKYDKSLCDGVSIDEKSISNEQVLKKSSMENSNEQSNQFSQFHLQSETESSISLENNLSTTQLSNETNLNNNEQDFKLKLDEHTNDLEKLTDKSIDRHLLNNESHLSSVSKSLENDSIIADDMKKERSNVLDVNENSKFSSDPALLFSSLVEGEEVFETNLNENSTLNSEGSKFDQFASVLESRDNSFNTANDSSLNATINTSIGSIGDSTLNSVNCSTKTLCSQSSQSYAEEKNLSVEKSNVVVQIDKEEVKEDYTDDAVANGIESKAEKSSILANSTDDITMNEEKFLNVTEYEFKNDSRIENVKELLEEITKKVSDDTERVSEDITANVTDNATVIENGTEPAIENPTESAIENPTELAIENATVIENGTEPTTTTENENETELTARTEHVTATENGTANKMLNESDSIVILDTSIKSDKSLNESEDNSICIIYEDPQINVQNGTKANSNVESNSSSPQIESETNSKVNLDESSDLEIVYDSTTSTSTANNEKVNHSQKTSKNQKQASNDDFSNTCEFYFEIPKKLCGLLIGTKGLFINTVMKKSNTFIALRDHPTILEMNLCVIKGYPASINEALALIRRRFPLKKFPLLTLAPTNPNLISLEAIPQNSNLVLAEGVNVEVLLSNFESPSHIFLQQPTHPTFNLLQRLNEYMISTYKFNETPGVDEPSVGIICAVQKDQGWYRAIVTDIVDDNCTVKLLDYGGFVTVPQKSLRQVCRDYMSIPFQSIECFLANIQPVNGIWSQESIEYFKQIAQKQILQAYIVEYTPTRIPLIFLYRVVDNQLVNINEELCMRGYAVCVK